MSGLTGVKVRYRLATYLGALLITLAIAFALTHLWLQAATGGMGAMVGIAFWGTVVILGALGAGGVFYGIDLRDRAARWELKQEADEQHERRMATLSNQKDELRRLVERGESLAQTAIKAADDSGKLRGIPEHTDPRRGSPFTDRNGW